VVKLDKHRGTLVDEVDDLRALRNEKAREIGGRKARGEDAEELIQRMRRVGDRIDALDGELHEVESDLEETLLRIPNLPDPRVPAGGEDDFEVLDRWGEPEGTDLAAADEDADGPPPHWEIAEELGILDLERGAKVAGSGFPLFYGQGAALRRALATFMLDLHRNEHGYREISPPYLVNRASMLGTGHLPKFEEDAYRTEPDDLFLVPTDEVPVTNLYRDEILEPGSLPRAFVASTPCFRREAGSAGRDTRGILRVHQFQKVELMRFTRPEDSEEDLELLTSHAEEVLRRLGLPYRRILLAGGDLGFGNAITYDLEVWAPGVGRWLEVSSCSSYTDYQARRADIRYRPEPGAGPEFVHTLNGSGVALARTVVALLEHGVRDDGSVELPEALHPYMGTDRLTPR
jgi:seryl-tRNA synthetase